MKKTLALLLTLSFAFAAQARTEQNVPSFCKIGMNGVENPEENFVTLSSVDIVKTRKVSKQLIAVINKHLQHMEYTTEDLTLQEIQDLFAEDGDLGYDDLMLDIVRIKKTNEIYGIVHSYPGENEYGYIYDTTTFKVLAEIQDGDIQYKDSRTGKGVYCPYEE